MISIIQRIVVRPFWGLCLLSFASASYCQRVNPNDPPWRNAQTVYQPPAVNSTALNRMCQLSNMTRINTYLDNILIPRPVGSTNHKKVAMYIKRTLDALGYTVEFDRFTTSTIVGERTFLNIIAVLDPLTPRRLTLACHYDSKDFRPAFEFLGAIDSAFPCAVLLDVATSLAPYISNRGATDVTLQLLFFDGEEAFRDWTDTDSLYGSKHLAQQMEGQLYPPYNMYNTRELHRIDYLVLLDLLGAEGSIPNYTPPNEPQIYNAFWETESSLRQIPGCMNTAMMPLFNRFPVYDTVQDDHLPFYHRGVRCMHMIPTPFPRVWHNIDDDRAHLDEGSMLNTANIVRSFTARYLNVWI